MTPEKKLQQLRNRAIRRNRNKVAKAERAEKRRAELIALGKTLIVTENEDGTKSYVFPSEPKFHIPSINRLAWVGGKMYKHSWSRKNSPGLKDEHAAAIIENASRMFAKEIEKALKPEQEEPNATTDSAASVVPGDEQRPGEVVA